MITSNQRYRHEYKYLISSVQQSILKSRAAGCMELDSHVNSDGVYIIRSLYFDDERDSCLNDNLVGADPRSKFRLRYYGSDTNRIVLEKKIKSRGLCRKESCQISVQECEALINGDSVNATSTMDDKKKKLLTELNLKCLKPKLIVTYKRAPFVCFTGNVRVTFDDSITSSGDVTEFLSTKYFQRPILETGQSILEVKWDEVIPLYIKEILNIENLNWTAFSKYTMCRMLHL